MTSLPEQELVRLCARTKVEVSTDAKIQSLARSPLEWETVIEIADHHGVLPLLYWNLNRSCPNDVPASILADLRERFRLNAQRNLMLTQELLAVLKLFRNNNIPAIPFKGPMLARMAYGDIALRQIADVDVLVRKSELSAARNVLLEHEYLYVHTMDRIQEKIFIQSNCALTLARENPRVVLDLHWELTPKYFYLPFDLNAMQARLQPVVLGGVSVQTFCAEDLLLILCVHGARHVWERLDWLVSVAELVRVSVLDWDALIARARQSRCQRMLWLGLELGRQWLDAELSSDIQEKIHADPVVATLAAKISERFWRAEEARENFFEDTFVDELHPLMFERWVDRARYYAALVFSPSAGDAAFFHLPSPFIFAYYLIRPIRLLFRFGPRWLSGMLRMPARTTS